MNEDKKVFDKEFTSKPIIFLKGVGRYCQAKGCNKHVFGYSNKKYCSNKCRWKSSSGTYAKKRQENIMLGIHSFVNLRKYGKSNPYRIMKIYLKKGVIQEVKITPDSKELWSLLEKIEQFRDISKPLEITA